MATTLVWIAYPLAVALVVLYGAGAMGIAFWRQKKQGHRDTTDFFLTARNSIGALRISWAFYAASMGSWALFSVAQYVSTAGIVGLIFYSLMSGVPIIMIAWLGCAVQKRIPGVVSLSDYALRRFGWPVQLWVSAIMLFNMGVGITAEYTALGNLFSIVIGSSRIPIVVIVGVVSSIYTAYGGLYVSIVTDQWQGLAAVLFILVTAIYVAVTYRGPVQRPLPNYLLGNNEVGLSSIAVMPISLCCATVFSEAFWQRCWASATEKSLKQGAGLACIYITVAVWFYGFMGFLVLWANKFDPNTDPTYSTVMFSIFNGNTGILVIIALLGTSMSTGAIDSYQNAIVDNISGVYLRHANVLYSRILVVLLNVPCIVCSLRGYGILNLFLLANLVTTTSSIPILLGLWRGKGAKYLVTSFTVLSGCVISFFSLIVYSAIRKGGWGVSMSQAVHTVFFEAYDYPSFVIALVASVVGVGMGACLELLVRLPLTKRFAWAQYPDKLSHMHEEPRNAIADFLARSDKRHGKVADLDLPGLQHTSNPAYETTDHEKAMANGINPAIIKEAPTHHLP